MVGFRPLVGLALGQLHAQVKQARPPVPRLKATCLALTVGLKGQTTVVADVAFLLAEIQDVPTAVPIVATVGVACQDKVDEDGLRPPSPILAAADAEPAAVAGPVPSLRRAAVVHTAHPLWTPTCPIAFPVLVHLAPVTTWAPSVPAFRKAVVTGMGPIATTQVTSSPFGS